MSICLPDELRDDSRRAARVRSLSVLLGVEGTAAARYFRAFPAMINEALRTGAAAYDFAKRNRRPPTDPVNALLSFT